MRAWGEAGRLSMVEVDQARQDEVQSRDGLLQAEQNYAAQLDDFKFFLGLPPHWLIREPYIPVAHRPPLLRAADLGLHAGPGPPPVRPAARARHGGIGPAPARLRRRAPLSRHPVPARLHAVLRMDNLRRTAVMMRRNNR